MSRADEIKAKTQRLKTHQADQTEHTEQPDQSTPKAQRPPRAKPVRRTVDLSPAHHAELDTWCSETARQLGQARVTGQDVLRTLVARLLTDETLARKVCDDLASHQ